MPDIKLTLSTDRRLRSQTIEDEARWVRESGRIFYPLGPNRPLRAAPGCWVYFVRDGQLVARGRADRFVRPRGRRVSYTGRPAEGIGWEVEISALQITRDRPAHEGFRGFRYVKSTEESRFGASFVGKPILRLRREHISGEGGGLGDRLQNAKVERAAIRFVMRWYRKRGWKVRSVERERCGYDLRCVDGREEDHVEVKGVAGTGITFFMTSGELQCARADNRFVLCITADTLSGKPRFFRFGRSEFLAKFDFHPVVYRAEARA